MNIFDIGSLTVIGVSRPGSPLNFLKIFFGEMGDLLAVLSLMVMNL